MCEHQNRTLLYKLLAKGKCIITSIRPALEACTELTVLFLVA